MPETKVRAASGGAKVADAPLLASTKPAPSSSPVIAPSGLMAAIAVPFAPGKSNVVIVPSRDRRKPCCAKFAS